MYVSNNNICDVTSSKVGAWFSVSKKGGTGGGGLVYAPKGENSMAVPGFGCKIPQWGHCHLTS